MQAVRLTSMTDIANRARRQHHRALTWASLAAVGAVLAVSACSGPSTSNSAGAPRAQFETAVPSAAPQAGAGRDVAGTMTFSAVHGGTGLAKISAVALARDQIKKAQIALRSDKVASVVTSIETVAAAQGGFIDSEDTSTDTHGVAQSSAVTLRVPVDAFTTTVDAVARLGRLESKKTTTVDVTGQVADVASRVSSAKDSITQLRLLFSHATKLGDIITLESELSARESDLEALQAQQRVLTAQTSLSTISVSVTRDQAPPPPSGRDDHAGFLGGLQQGWDALVTTFDNVAHALGAALPIGITVVTLALLGWAAVRRLPRRRAGTSG